MQFEHGFDVEGSPDEVLAVFDDVPLLASFLPGASAEPAGEDGSHPGRLVVAFGPKRLTFKGSLTNRLDRAQRCGQLDGRASSDVRGAKMAVAMHYRLAPAAAGTRIDIVSEAELTGILAEFARAGGQVLTQALLEEFAQRLGEHLRTQRAAAGAGPQPVSAVASAQAAAGIDEPATGVPATNGAAASAPGVAASTAHMAAPGMAPDTTASTASRARATPAAPALSITALLWRWIRSLIGARR